MSSADVQLDWKGLTMLSINIKIMVLMAIVTSFAISTSPAFGEFKSKNGKAEGESGALSMLFEGGGAFVSCLATTASPATWIVENAAKEHVTQGLKLIFKIKTFGSCLGSGGALTKITVTSSECEFEANQKGTELSVAASVVSTCTMKAVVLGQTCEIKIEPNDNKELQSISLGYTGLENQNLALEPTLLNVTTHVNSVCEIGGVKSTKTGVILAFSEGLQLGSGTPMPEIVLGVGGSQEIRNGETRQIAALNSKGGNGAKLRSLTTLTERENPYTVTNIATCRNLTYKANEFCSFEVKQTNVATFIKTIIIKAISENGGESAVGLHTKAGT